MPRLFSSTTVPLTRARALPYKALLTVCPDVMEIAEGIPFVALTRYDVPTLYSLKGEIVRRGVKAITGIDMPVYPKRRF